MKTVQMGETYQIAALVMELSAAGLPGETTTLDGSDFFVCAFFYSPTDSWRLFDGSSFESRRRSPYQTQSAQLFLCHATLRKEINSWRNEQEKKEEIPRPNVVYNILNNNNISL